MSNPEDVPQQPGSFPPQAGNSPPAGAASQPDRKIPEGYGGPPQAGNIPPAGAASQPDRQVPEGYGDPPQGHRTPPQGYQTPPQGYQTPGEPARPVPAGGIRFEMPAGRPQSFNDVLPQGGFSGMFTVTGMPAGLKVSYWIWLVSGLLGLLGGVIGLFGSFVIFAMLPALGLLVLLLVLAALALAAAQVVLAMKMKEGREWARFALTVVAGISLLLAIINTSAAEGRGGGSWPGFIISLAATVLMWTPSSQAWFAGVRGRTQ